MASGVSAMVREEGSTDGSTLGNAHLKLALFADEQLKIQDQYFSSTG